MSFSLFADPSPDPPYGGTIFIAPKIITNSDPTAFIDLKESGNGERVMFDRRKDDWVKLRAHLFIASYKISSDSPEKVKIEIQVNPEFSPEEAKREASYYAPIIGRLPMSLREDVQTVWIHKGNNDYGGGNNNLLIHTGRTVEYVNKGILEETFIHEAVHTSLDENHSKNENWIKAQKMDSKFISTYAKNYPQREDLAETFLLSFAIKYKKDRIPEEMKNLIQETIPNRLKYLDKIKFDSFPVNMSK